MGDGQHGSPAVGSDVGGQTPVRHFLFSPASSYPIPYASLIDEAGNTTHTWSNPAEQPYPEDSPPTFLRGWNHVELDRAGDLFAIVPLHCVLKLNRDSRIIWKACVAAHHDLAPLDSGDVYVLTESPRVITCDGQRLVILDNEITMLSPSGIPRCVLSLYDVLHSHPVTRALLIKQVLERRARFTESGWPERSGLEARDAVAVETRALLESGSYSSPLRRALQLLRQLPGSPCDVIHSNTVEILDEHPRGVWQRGDLLVSFRNLNMIAVIDKARQGVLWTWGDRLLSGQHQPSALPNGNVLVFDNGAGVGRSRLLEVNPTCSSIDWEYVANPPESFFSEVAGGCELLPNGNILVTEAQSGRAFQVTKDRRIVWNWTVPAPVSHAGRATIYRLSGVPLETARRIIRDGFTEIIEESDPVGAVAG